MSDWGVRLSDAVDAVPFEVVVVLWVIGLPLIAVLVS